MIRQLWNLSIHTRAFLRRYMPTNILLDAASIGTSSLASGGPGWLSLLVLLFCWNALRFVAIGPVSLVLLARAQIRKHHER